MRLKLHNGFSLIELMVVVSITSVLSSLGLVGMKQVKYQALQTESKRSLNMAHILVASWHSSNERYFDTTFCTYNGVYNGLPYCMMSGRDRTNCNYPNPFGYQDMDCAKSNYSMTFGGQGVTDVEKLTGWRIESRLKADTISNNLDGADGLLKNACGQLCHFYRITNFAPLTYDVFPDCDGDGSHVKFWLCETP